MTIYQVIWFVPFTRHAAFHGPLCTTLASAKISALNCTNPYLHPEIKEIELNPGFESTVAAYWFYDPTSSTWTRHSLSGD